MFGLLRPKPPLGPWEKAWVETRMHWLAAQFGIQRMLEAEVVLPNEEFFAGDFQGSENDARRYLELVFQYMGADSFDVRFEIGENCQCSISMPREDDGDQRAVIEIPKSCLDDPQLLVATLAHQVAYDLLRRNRLLAELDDGPWVADLLTVFLGLGVVSTNGTVLAPNVSPAGGCSGKTEPYGYLPTRMLAYSLALFACLREESSPRWARHLGQDGGVLFGHGVRYLRRTDDSLFRISSLHLQRSALSLNDLMAELNHRSDSQRIAALWSLAERGDQSLAAVDAVSGCLRAKDPSVRAEAAATLAAFGTGISEPALEQLVECLQDGDPQVRASTAYALGIAGADSQTVALELASALDDESPQVVGAAAMAIQPYGSTASDAVDAVLRALRASLVHCHNENAARLTATLLSIVPDAERQVFQFFDEHDSELRHIALEILAEQSIERTV